VFGAQPDPKEALPGDAEIARLIEQLGSEEFEKREAAAKRLEAVGELALLSLCRATGHADPEVRERARQLLQTIGTPIFRTVRLFEGHTLQVNCLALSADGRRLLTGSLDTTMRLWDVATGKELRQFPDQPGGVWAVALSADGKRGLSSAGMLQKDGNWVRGSDFTILLWDLEAGKVLRRLEGHTSELRSVVFSPDGRQALSAGWDKVIRLWDLESGKEVRRFEGHTDSVRQAVFSPDGRRILSASKDQTVRLWDAASGKETACLKGHNADVFTAVFTPDGRRCLSGGADKIVRQWDLASGKELRRSEGHSTVIWNLAISPDGRRALSVAGTAPRGDGFYQPSGMDYEVRLWDVESGKEVFALPGHTSSIMSVLFLPDGRRALTAGSDTIVRLWNLSGQAKD